VTLRSIALLAGLLAACGAAAQAAAPQAPAVTRADGGATIITQADPAAPLVHVTVVVQAGLDRQTLVQSGLAALTAETVLQTPVDGSALVDAVAARGGSVHFTVDPEGVRFAVEAIPAQAPGILSLFERALGAPSFTPATLANARRVLQARIAENGQLALQVGVDMLDANQSGTPNRGLPSLGLPQVIAQTTARDVQAFYAAYYRRGGSYVSAAGQLAALAPGALNDVAAVLAPGTTAPVAVDVPKLEGQSRQYVAHRNIASPWLVAQYPAPAIGSKDFGAMLVLASFMQRTLADIAQVPDVVSPTYASHAVGSLYRYDRPQPTLLVYVNGGIGSPDRTFETALSIADILAQTKLQGSIEAFKAFAIGDFINDSNDLETRAWLAVAFDRSTGSADYVARITDAVNATTASDLQRAAKAYLGTPAVALVLPRSS
jgi:predicted Zn-dependent peptidase